MDTTHYEPFGRCAVFRAGEVELFVTLDFGPRIIRLGHLGAPNVFHESKSPRSPGSFNLYGGHRLWIAPEAEDTFAPDNTPVRVSANSFEAAPDRRGVARALRIEAHHQGFAIDHVLRNDGEEHQRVSPWALSVLTGGSTAYLPRSPYRPHGDDYRAAGPLVLWHYTDFDDPRLRLGKRLITLRHDAKRGPEKLGAFISQGWGAASVGDQVFVKRFGARPDEYPDFGCNAEIFTNEDFLELESLGPLQTLAPGQSTTWREVWSLHRGALPKLDDEEALAAALEAYSL